MVRSALGIIVLLVLAGCGKKDTAAVAPPTKVAESAVPSGWKVMTAGGASMAFPGDWIAVDVSRPDVVQTVEHLGLKGAEGEMLKNQIRQFASTGVFKIVAFAPMKPGEFQTNANINVIPVPATDLKGVLDENKKEFAKVGKVLESGIVENPRRAVIIAENEYTTAGGQNVLSITQVHFMLRGQEMITIAFGSAPQHRDAVKKIADQAMKTFAYNPPTP